MVFFTEDGSIVVKGFPRYSIENSIIILTVTERILNAGIVVLQFVHPDNGKKIQLPAFGGDEHVDSVTHRIFVIFVDNRGKTFLIFRGYDRKISPKLTPDTKLDFGEYNDGK